ncbi:MAG: anti-sigma factor antagonist [Leptospiraceae bacterium]|nr:anti-sigma factor antagonist [Leptospiraceae bacterium]
MNSQLRGDILLLELFGPLDSRTAADFRIFIQEKLLEGFRHILLDCRDLEYVSSAGIGVLVQVSRLVKNHGGSFGLCSVGEEVERLLGFLGVLREIEVVSDVEAFQAQLPQKTEAHVAHSQKIDVNPELKEEAKSSLDKSQMEELMACPNCGVSLRVGKKGRYLCPSCHFVFSYS